MKKTFIILSSAVLFSCNKSTSEAQTYRKEFIINKQLSGSVDSTVVATLSWKNDKPLAPKETRKYEYQYEAFDGSVADVTFTHSNTQSYLLIERNKLKIELPKTKEDSQMVLFEKEGIKAKVQGLNLELSQGKEVIELKVKP